MKNFIITEGSFDKKVLEKILPYNILKTNMLVEGMGYSSAVSLAKSIFLNGNAKILLVLDADTTDEQQIKEKENYIKNTFNLISSDSEYKLLYVVPEIESLFFVDKDFIEKTFKIQMNETEFELSKLNPKSSLKKMTKEADYTQTINFWLNTLPSDIIKKMQEIPVVDEMIRYAAD